MIKNNPVIYGLCAATSLFSVNAMANVAPEQEAFFDELRQHCGQAYAGTITAGDKDDSTFGGKTLVMHVRECSDTVIKIPFHVGEDRSRTWVITKTDAGLRLKHDHRHQDGSEDKVTQYGGDTANAGSEHKQSFPVDGFSQQMLVANNLPQAVTNVWHMYVTDDTFAYQLTRENRNFKVDFDLTTPITPPPAPWGHK